MEPSKHSRLEIQIEGNYQVGTGEIFKLSLPNAYGFTAWEAVTILDKSHLVLATGTYKNFLDPWTLELHIFRSGVPHLLVLDD